MLGLSVAHPAVAQVHITPHVSGYLHMTDFARHILQNVHRFQDGQRMVDEVDWPAQAAYL
jgi:phosphoglycerate dehydrogenase-like enzyme